MSEITFTTGFEDLVIEIVDSNGESICSFEGESLKLVLQASIKSFFDSVISSIPEPFNYDPVKANYDPAKDLARSEESQIAALRAVHDLTIQYGYAPSVRAVGAALGRSSSSTAQRIVDYLKRRGWVEYTPRVARSLKITEKGFKVLEADKS